MAGFLHSLLLLCPSVWAGLHPDPWGSDPVTPAKAWEFSWRQDQMQKLICRLPESPFMSSSAGGGGGLGKMCPGRGWARLGTRVQLQAWLSIWQGHALSMQGVLQGHKHLPDLPGPTSVSAPWAFAQVRPAPGVR